MTNGRALSQLQPRSQRQGCCGLPPVRAGGWMSCLLPGAPSAHTHACRAAFPPRLDVPRPSWTSFFFLDTAGVVLGTEISLFSTSFHPYDTAYEKWTFFSLFLLWLPPSNSIIFFLFENKSFVSSRFKKLIYLAVLGLCCCSAFSLFVPSRAHSLIAACGLPIQSIGSGARGLQ